jgi:hypothetical protein
MGSSSHKNLVWRVLVERERRSVADRKEMVNDPTQREPFGPDPTLTHDK